MIYTSYFANVKNLPRTVVPIAICGRSPDGWTGYEYKRLAPKWDFFQKWKKDHDNDYYIEQFNTRVIGKLNPQSVMGELLQMCEIWQDPCLICYEKPGDFCHRHLVAKWLRNAGYKVEEYFKR